jgi:hypothetical protein
MDPRFVVHQRHGDSAGSAYGGANSTTNPSGNTNLPPGNDSTQTTNPPGTTNNSPR